MKEIKETQATPEETKQLSYEEALKAFKAEWATKRKEERKQKASDEKAKEREADIEVVKEILPKLDGLHNSSKKELEAVIIRLNMFIKGERYTRKVGDK